MTDNNAHRGAEAQLTLRNSPAYRVAYSMYVALGGDPKTEFNSVEEIYDAIDVLFGKGNNRITVEAIAMEIVENGDYNFDDEEVTGYKPVNIKVEVPQKYTDEQVETIRVEAENNGYNNGYGVGMNDGFNIGYGAGYAEGDTAGQQTGYNNGYTEGFTQGETEGYNDGYAEGLDDGAEDQKALLEDITITENGVYEKEDGYKKVTVEMAAVPSGDGFDFSVLGYNAGLSNNINSGIQTNIDYSKTFADNWNVSNTTINDTNLVYFPNIDTSNVTNFYPNKIEYIDTLNLPAVTQFYGSSYKFYKSPIKYVGDVNLPNVNSLEQYFYNSGVVVGNINAPKATTANQLFGMEQYGSVPDNLTTVGDIYIPNVSNCNSMFYYRGKLTSLGTITVDVPTTTREMFYLCQLLENIEINLTTTDCASMFSSCRKLKNITGDFKTSGITDCTNMFNECYKIEEIPWFDTSSVTKMYKMFSNCTKLTTLPALDTSKVTYMQEFIRSCDSLTTLPALRCDSLVTNTDLIGQSSSWGNYPNLVNFGGFINLGMQEALYMNTEFISRFVNMTYDSAMNIINGLYDRASAGYSVLNLKFHSNTLALLSDADIAIATNKGWTIS